MKKMVVLDYTFIFEPDSTWSRLSEFEQDLADFFAAYGLQGERMDTMRGQPDKSIMIIKRVDKMFTDQVAEKQLEQKAKEKGPQDQMKKIQQNLQLVK